MTRRSTDEGDISFASPAGNARWKRLLKVIPLAVLGFLLLFWMTWRVFFHYVPPGQMLVIVAKNGEELKPGQVVAEEGQKGIRKKVLGEGWHYVTPILYTTELWPNTVIKPGYVGIETALGGDRPSEDRVLAEKENEQGIRRQVLLPGSYRLNPHAFKVEEVPATRINPGYVGVLRRLLGKDSGDRFAHNAEEKGILREVLQPGTYYLNTREFEIIPCEVGIYQTSYHYIPESKKSTAMKSTAITFPARDSYMISMDCTIEWEVQPVDWPELLAEFRSLHGVEQYVVDQHAKRISRTRGFNYGAQDFLEGEKREKFQSDFTEELKKACKDNKVVVRSAFIRTMVIPETFLKPKRELQLAAETSLTNQAKTETAQTEAEVATAKSMIDQAEAKVRAETERLVAGIERETANVQVQNEAEIEALKAKYGTQIAELEAERTRLLGKAEAESRTLNETAKSGIYKLKMDVFQNDGSAYLRYTLADKLNPKLMLRLFHSGPGTFWTNLGDKNLNLMLPVPSPGTDGKQGSDTKPATPAK